MTQTNEPTIICPQCKAEIKLTESLAAPIIESTRREFETRLAEKDAEVAEKMQEERLKIAAEEAKKAKLALDADLQQQAQEIADLQGLVKQRDEKLAEAQKAQTELARERIELEDAKRELEMTVQEQLREGREKIAAEAERRVRLSLDDTIEQQARAVADLQAALEEREEKLAAAQNAQAELLRKQRDLDTARRELELTVETRIQEGLDVACGRARKDAEDAMNLKLMEGQQTIASMQKQIEELKRKAEQGSQQLQGEVQELELEALLTARFPMDNILPVPKGEYGGDALQCVVSPLFQPCGTILWESKRTKNWSDSWLPKLRDDQRTAKAEVAVIISQALPKGIDTFDLVDGVWVVHPKTAIPVAICLRQMLIDVSLARQSSEGQKTKAEIVYQYLIGPGFRHRVEAIVEAFSSMQDDLAREKKLLTKQWAKREAQIGCVMAATVGMYGDLQGIAGRTLQEIEGLSLPSLEDHSDDNAPLQE